MFIIGGLSGIFMAATPVDMYIHNTYFIVAHIHYVLFMSSVFGLFAAVYFWYPKMFGRMMSDSWGKVHFALTFIAANCTFYPMHIIGIRGAPRRYFDMTGGYLDAVQPLNVFISISAIVMGLAQLIFVANFVYSLFWGKKASRNPWNANSLEWGTPSPPGHGNFERTPIVVRGPYEYSDPDVTDRDYSVQAPNVENAPADQPVHV
jgi:cytochrome c oxidase subunit 1